MWQQAQLKITQSNYNKHNLRIYFKVKGYQLSGNIYSDDLGASYIDKLNSYNNKMGECFINTENLDKVVNELLKP